MCMHLKMENILCMKFMAMIVVVGFIRCFDYMFILLKMGV